MKEKHLLSYLIHANKGLEEDKQISPIGSEISETDELGQMLLRLLNDSERECDISIIFSPSETGEKKNLMQDLILQFCEIPSLQNGLILAEKLSICTPQNSGLCLLFILLEKNDNKDATILLSRFPADIGVLADSTDGGLKLAYVKQVFMKSQNRYKAVLYRGKSVADGLMFGKAIDKQVNYGSVDLAKYWIFDFLESTYKDSSGRGTRRFTQALKDAVKRCDSPEVTKELTGIALLLPRLGGKSTSISQILAQYQLSEEAQHLIIASLENPQTKDTVFLFDSQEALSTIPFKSIELDNQAIMIAPSTDFEKIFVPSDEVSVSGKLTYTTQGKIVKEQFRARK